MNPWIPADHRGVDDDGREYVTLCGGRRIFNVHQPYQCQGRPCPVHSISNHPMNAWPQRLTHRGMARVCAHGIMHPDPDESYLKPDHVDLGGDKCDGCCEEETPQLTI